MKYLFSFLLFVLFCYSAQAQIINFPDPDFKNALVNTKCVDTNSDGLGDVDADVNNDGEIDIIEAESIVQLVLRQATPKLNSIDGIQFFKNLRILDCSYNKLQVIDLNSLPNLEVLNCVKNQITQLNIIDLPKLTRINCSYNKISSLILNNLPILYRLDCNNNSLSELEINHINSLQWVNCGNNILGNLNLDSLSNLNVLWCSYNNLNTLNIDMFRKLTSLSISNNEFTEIEVVGFEKLNSLNCSYNKLTSMVLSNLPNLEELNCKNNKLTTLDVNGFTKINTIYCMNNLLTNLFLQDLPNLFFVHCNSNRLETLTALNLPQLRTLEFEENSITTLNLNNLPILAHIFGNTNKLTSIQLDNLPYLYEIEFNYNKITSLQLTNLPKLYKVSVAGNSLTSLKLQNLPRLEEVLCNNNKIDTLSLENFENLLNLDCSYNQLTLFEIKNSPKLKDLKCNNNNLTSLYLDELVSLEYLESSSNQINTLQIKNSPNLKKVYCYYNTSLINLILKGSFLNEGNFNGLYLAFGKKLKYICCDEILVEKMRAKLISGGLDDFEINTYCSFTPNGNYNVIKAQITFHESINNCNNPGLEFPFYKYYVKDSNNNEGYVISDENGIYYFPVTMGINSITPINENPDFFTVSPSFFSDTFPSITDTITQNFCITPIEPFRQVNITIIPLSPPARPGFDAQYKIIWQNKGNLFETGTIHFTYDENIFDYVSADETPDVINSGNLSWDYTDLLPFEKREVIVTLNLNSPMENPPVNAGDITYLYANILDNVFRLENVIVGSYDPNDKTCLQGQYFHPDSVGKYVDFLIRFENTGNFAAENVVIKDIIDDKVFDVSSLLITDASHEVYTRIAANKVEFIFENIQLPFEDEFNDGYVAFKIKTKSTLKLGDEMKNLADIYFDYNFPIRTNETQTTIAIPSGTKDIQTEVTIHPNPVRHVLTLDSSTRWTKAEIFDISGRLIKVTGVEDFSVDVSGLDSGTYILHLSDKDKRGRVKFVKM